MGHVPVLKLGTCLLVTVPAELHDRLALELQEALTRRIAESGATGVLIDISALEVVDSFVGRILSQIAAMSSLLDTRTVVVGMRSDVAITLVELGLRLPGILTALNVDRGMELLRVLGAAGRRRDDREA